MGFAEWLTTTRKGRAISQVALSMACVAHDQEEGFSQARISEWERGLSLPGFRQLVILEKALALAPSEVREGRDAWESAQAGDLMAGPDHAGPPAAEVA